MTETAAAPSPTQIASGIAARIAGEIGCRAEQVAATVQLLDEGSTVPFVARYRKEATGGLDDTQLRTLEERLVYLREMEDRRATILKSVEEQGKLTPELAGQFRAADTKAALEDLYLPYKQKRRTKAQIAREAGLEPLADSLLADPALDPQATAAGYVDADKNVADTKAALDGARQILTERFAENAALIGRLRDFAMRNAVAQSRVVEGKKTEGAKFSDYFEYREKWADIPSHRALALFRGRNEGILALDLAMDGETGEAADAKALSQPEMMIAGAFDIADRGRPADKWLTDCARWAWKVKIALHLDLDLMNTLREKAEEEAIRVFARNLKDLLLAAPAGRRATLGLDPGIRTGVKVAVVDATGKLIDTSTVYPFQPRNDVQGALAALKAMVVKHDVDLIAIGNGTASRETDRLAAELIKMLPGATKPTKVIVSEAGASVYSASALAAREMPDVDVSLRGAASIARRLQDPLAELVKIEPQSIGVGQYQHDVNQARLARALDAVVEDAVNAVGVDLNMASAPLLARISGLSEGLAQAIVDHRNASGAFKNRKELLKVARLGPKAFEQCAGFLRITGGDNPLDASSVHPEAYPLAKKIVNACGRDIRQLMGDAKLLAGFDPSEFTDERFGLPTVQDLFKELEKPGRDPRPEFKTAAFQDGVETIADLKPGMMLEGTVTNITNFGAFVDIGVHQDGLVHVSQMADRFIQDPHAVVKTGEVVTVRVLEIDLPRKRIALTMKKDTGAARETHADARKERPAQPKRNNNQPNRGAQGKPGGQASRGASPDASGGNSAMAAALAAAMAKSRKD
ncbi:Tex family protein [Breoghania sp. L-A4]|uniref:Tex family protein n=1 Tax=Breoghania sp. L-A4 TaxID=2304600 RepID=UPI000E35FD22|nr:Tex family protein [Breoghania sp. L-A4]AXS39840.1 RNA-binding transcriptional accessory protein [Breoghania sp. L-A4]